jgi:Tol biopolymer transport system component
METQTMTTRTAVLALCCGAAFVTVACNQRPIQISDSATGAYEAALAPFDEGFAVAWYDTRDGNAEIYTRLLDADGRVAGPERRLTHGPEESYEASIDRLGDRLALAWYDQTAEGQQTAKLGVWTRDGVNRWLHALDSGTRNPVIRTTATAVFCAWIQSEADGREAVFARWWDTDGRPRAAPLRLGPASKTTWNLNAAIDEQGTGWVAFDAEVSTRASEVYVAKVDGAGAGAIRLTKDDGAPSKYPDLSIGADGRAALSWQEERDGNVEVYLLTGNKGDLAGEIDGRSRRITNTPGESTGAYLAWNGDRLGLAWSDKTPGQPEVYLESFDGSGTSREQARRITQSATWSLVPAIRPRGTGFALAWNEYQPASIEIHNGTSQIFFTAIP